MALGQQIFCFGEEGSCLVARRGKGSPKIFPMLFTPEVTLLSLLALLLHAGDNGCGMGRASLALCQAPQVKGHRQTKTHSEALSALSVLPKGTGKRSSSDSQAQNSPRSPAMQQGHTARDRGECAAPEVTAQRWQKQEGPAWQRPSLTGAHFLAQVLLHHL